MASNHSVGSIAMTDAAKLYDLEFVEFSRIQRRSIGTFSGGDLGAQESGEAWLMILRINYGEARSGIKILAGNRANTQTPTSHLTPFTVHSSHSSPSCLPLRLSEFTYVPLPSRFAAPRSADLYRGRLGAAGVQHSRPKPSLVPRSDALTSFACAQRPRRSCTLHRFSPPSIPPDTPRSNAVASPSSPVLRLESDARPHLNSLGALPSRSHPPSPLWLDRESTE